MTRRHFLRTAGQTTALALWGAQCRQKPPLDIVARLVEQNDKRLPELLKKQDQNALHFFYGGVKDAYGIHSAGLTAAFIRDLTCAWLSPQSVFYRSEILPPRLERAAQYLLNIQHSDGTIDLPSTNFHSTPDTAFVLEWLCGAYGLLRGDNFPAMRLCVSRLESFILKAAEALTTGGIHTPNHRWVVCMALARINALFPQERLVRRIDEWLGEHIDINPDGQFSEKSTAIYSPLTDRCLITMARLLGRDELLEPVRKNLDMTLYYLQPNGEIVTDASKRQDQYTFASAAPYYYPYRFMALRDKNGQFAALALQLEENPREIAHNLLFLLEDKNLAAEPPAPAALPDNYEKFFSHSKLARFRRRQVSATIIADDFALFSFRNGEANLLAVRLASAFFGEGQFKGEKLELVDGAYVMEQKLDGPYYQPYPKKEIPVDGDWEKMDKKKRPKSEVQVLTTTVTVREKGGAFALRFDLAGTSRVPVAIELAFRHGGKLTGVEKCPDIEDAFFLKKGMGSYAFKGQKIKFGPGLHDHAWTQLRGAEEKLDALSIYLTGFTPLSWTLHISPG